MKASKKLTGFALASAAALMLTACGGEPGESADQSSASATSEQAPADQAPADQSATPAPAQEAQVKCSGVNACKGQSACATATTSCKGHNTCKGQGWVKTTAADCDAQGGTAG